MCICESSEMFWSPSQDTCLLYTHNLLRGGVVSREPISAHLERIMFLRLPIQLCKGLDSELSKAKRQLLISVCLLKNFHSHPSVYIRISSTDIHPFSQGIRPFSQGIRLLQDINIHPFIITMYTHYIRLSSYGIPQSSQYVHTISVYHHNVYTLYPSIIIWYPSIITMCTHYIRLSSQCVHTISVYHHNVYTLYPSISQYQHENTHSHKHSQSKIKNCFGTHVAPFLWCCH
jgi:hypothetical protein